MLAPGCNKDAMTEVCHNWFQSTEIIEKSYFSASDFFENLFG